MERRSSVNRGVDGVLIEGSNQHLTMDAFSTHDPSSLTLSTSLHAGVLGTSKLLEPDRMPVMDWHLIQGV